MATKTMTPVTPQSKFLSKLVFSKLKDYRDCVKADAQANKGMVNQSPSTKTIMAKIAFDQAMKESKSEIDNPHTNIPMI